MKREIAKAVMEVLERWDTLTAAGGQPIRSLEEEFATQLGVPHVVSLSSGTMAIEVALRAAGVGPGDEVIIPAYDWGASAGAILRCGATPVLADICPVRATVNPEAVETAISSRTHAVIITHLFGCPADMDALVVVAKRHGLFVIEDCCQALGASLHGRPIGTFGDAAVYSFGWGKIICAGEGGMLTFQAAELRRRAIRISQHPIRQRLDTGDEDLGDLACNGRIHPIAAALARVQLKALPSRIVRRHKACLYLSQQLMRLPGVVAVEDPPDGHHAFHRYSPLLDSADAVVERLSQAGWAVHRGYLKPLYLREPFRGRYSHDEFPGAERRLRESIGIELSWDGVRRRELDRVVSVFARALGNVKG